MRESSFLEVRGDLHKEFSKACTIKKTLVLLATNLDIQSLPGFCKEGLMYTLVWNSRNGSLHRDALFVICRRFPSCSIGAIGELDGSTGCCPGVTVVL